MLASFSVLPVGIGEALSEHVARIIDIIDASGLDYRLGAMETTVEGGEGDEMPPSRPGDGAARTHFRHHRRP